MTTPNTAPMYATIKAHGSPDRALWYGNGLGPDDEGKPCTIRATSNGWRVQVEDGKPMHITTSDQVWLGPLMFPGGVARQVLNPAPVPILLRTATSTAYRMLSTALKAAATAANDAAAVAAVTAPQEVADMLVVRDALRKAAINALAPVYLGAGKAVCRRCGAACADCVSPDHQ
jgi:hypothetical protein